MTYSMKNEAHMSWVEFLVEYEKAIKAEINISAANDDKMRHNLACMENALRMLLDRYIDELPPWDCDRFHKTFRQTDVCDFHAPEGKGGLIDMVFWEMLYAASIFWKVQDKLIKTKDLQAQMVEEK